MMLTALFLVWLQMSAQAGMVYQPKTWTIYGGCEEGGQVIVATSHGNEAIAQCHDKYWEKYTEPRAADETDGKPQLVCKRNMDTGEITPKECAEPNKPPDHLDWYWIDQNPQPHEPVDVPAVQVLQNVIVDCVRWEKNNCIKSSIISKPQPTCKDKSRILEHDENSPPKYWCRKVQW